MFFDSLTQTPSHSFHTRDLETLIDVDAIMLGRPSAFDHIKPLAGWLVQPSNGPLTPPCWPDSRDFLSPHNLGYDITRPSSATSTHSAPPLAHNIPFKGAYGHNVQLPALSTLASLAAASVPANDR